MVRGFERPALNLEILFVNQHGVAVHAARRNFSGARRESHGLEGFLEMQLARAAVVVHAVGEVAGLLGFQNDDAGAHGVDRSGIDKNHVACVDGDHFQQVFESGGVDSGANLFGRDAGLDAERDARPGVGMERVPAFGFAARLAVFPRHGVVGMHLHGELVFGEKQLDEQRKLAVSKMACQKLMAMLRGDVLEATARRAGRWRRRTFLR